MSQSGEKSNRSTPAPDRKSGRAVFDEGRTVWEWQTATGVFQRQVSDEQLARLENAGLQLVEQDSDTGRAIYGARPTGNQKAFVARPTPVVRAAPANTLRQFWRRLLPST